MPEGLFCDFAFRVEQSGKTKTIELPGGRTISIFPGVEWTITNLDNENQQTFRIPGSFHTSTLENGNVEVVATGRNILGDPVEHFLVLVIGRWSFTVDPLGNVVQPLQGTGQRVDICELLA